MSTVSDNAPREAVRAVAAGRDAAPTPGLLETCERNVVVRAHQLFRWLFAAQWICAVAIAGWTAPRILASAVWVALIGGALCTVPALLLVRHRPAAWWTRAVVALSQGGFSVLFIHLSGGRLEAHFHVFGSLAFLALYRDWRLPPLTSVLVLAYQLAGLWWPGEVFGAAPMSGARVLEHACWLLFANAALISACLMARRELRETCAAQEQHQLLLSELERRIRERTSALESEIMARENTAAALRASEQRHRELTARLPIGIFETTRSGKVRFANAHALSLVGLPAHIDPTAISLADGLIFPVTEREQFWHDLENRGEVRAYTATLRHFDGSSFDVLINARLKLTAPGEELAAEGTIEDVTQRRRSERELEVLHGQLVLASRQAGMAEVATGVLHNVGNVLTSVNLIVHDVQDRLKATRLSHLHRVVEIVQRERDQLGTFLTTDPTGRQLPDFLVKLDEFLTQENEQLLKDVGGLVRHFEHIREIIVTQQGSAQMFGIVEMLDPAQLFEDALLLNAESRERHGIKLEREFAAVSKVKADRHKVLQILVNLMRNAKDALQSRPVGERRIRVRVAKPHAGVVELSIEDNGTGIPRENLTRIFQHGYTTKKTGHGFGLHSSVLAAREMAGDLVVTSPGPDQGATFTLTLPAATTP